MSKIIRFHQTGGPDVLQIDNVDVAAPKAKEVQIRVKALGINRAEIMYRTGQYVIEPQFPAVLGYEAAGIVEAVGPDVTEFVVGDTVSVVPAFSFADYGLYGELVNAPAHAVVKHPENLSFIEAAATWMMFVTAYGALIEFGKLEAGETVLIGAASSSVGLAAIQIANMVGATPIALTRSSKKRQALLDAGAVHVIATQEQDLISEVMALTDGKGARMAFDPVGGPDAGKILQTLSMQGIFFQYGALDNRDIPVPVMDILSKHLTLRGYELFEITGDLDKLEQAKNFINHGLANGELRPIINRAFAFEEMAEAHSYMESNTQVGKIVVTL
ncbi:zinc-dependent alcohol dehydrogenase family protein [Psychrobacter alimentarius]|uniref:zinc-dependent alcohol dehydrogenase family protein n=1 Tax=Psychrobacter TaxID=497 RepID=UPI000BAAF445|nr:zinc-dependent alcohol dehydrogenase family protein [Psychrobacter sp. JB193]PAT62348.1 alcohol dehydrogenase [Psychrobacter sp. JB193]